MAEKSINISRRLSFVSLGLAWLTVFAIPAVLLQISLEYLFSITLQANRQAAIAALPGEMNSFRHDLKAETFIERKLQRFFADSGVSKSGASEIAETLNSASGLKAAIVVTHSSDVDDLETFVAAHMQQELPTLSRSMLRRYFTVLSQWHAETAIERPQSLSRSRKDADTFFRRQFGLISEIPLEPGLVCRTVSSKFGGPVFFFYWSPASSDTLNKKTVGGCLVILRGLDLDQKRILSEAVDIQARGIRRSFARLNIALDREHHLTRSIITDYFADETGQHMISTFPDSALVDLIQGGGLVPHNLDRVLARLPLLRVTMPVSELRHPLAERASLIFGLARLIVCFGAVFLLRLYFFGIDFKMGIRPKVLFGTSAMLLLPVSLLLAGLITWNQFNKVYGWYQAEELQRLYFNELYEGFSHYQASLQRHTVNVADSLKKMRNAGEDECRRIVERGLEKSVASELFYDLDSGKRIYARSGRFFKPSSREEESGRRLVASAILNGFDRSGNFFISQARGKEREPGTLDSSFVNELGNRWGRPFKMMRINVGTRFSTAFVFNDDNYSLYGLLSFKYHDGDLIRDYILNHFKPSAEFAGINARFFEVIEDGPGYSLAELASGKTLPAGGLLEKVKLAKDVESFVWRENNRNLLQVRWFNDYPLVMLVSSEALTAEASARVWPGILLSYGILLLVFVYLVFELIYLKPLREFIRVTGEVESGNLQVAVQLQANDEFADLKAVFSEMIQGLDQRRKLTHFVSQDVLSAVESDSGVDMAPGGVRLAATVVFIQLLPAAADEQIAPETRFAILDRFIGEGDQIARSCGGVIDKVIENTLMLVFRAATAGERHSLQACRATLLLAAAVRAAGYGVCAGVASGNVVSGLGKLDYTVIGDTVNLAARLKTEAAKAGTTGIIVAPSTIRGLRGQGRVAFIERVEIKGKSREYPLYELLELR